MAKAKDENRVVVKVFLYGIQPQIWRRFSISRDVTFIALSDAIQAAMGWATSTRTSSATARASGWWT
jgi:hypothetical protein